MSKILLLPYKKGSGSISELRKRLPILYATNQRIEKLKVLGKEPLILNWGWGVDNQNCIPDFIHHSNSIRYVNNPSVATICSDKLNTYNHFCNSYIGALMPSTAKISNIRSTLNYFDSSWKRQKTCPIIVRTKLNGSGGDGTHYFESMHLMPDEIIKQTKLVSRYIPKTAEYRVHVFNGEVIHVQEKRRRQGDKCEDDESKIRSYDNGWIFCQEDVAPPPSVKLFALEAVRSLNNLRYATASPVSSCTFGAVDVIWNKFYGAFVTEVNTAPGIEGTTADKYAEAIANYYNNYYNKELYKVTKLN